MTSFLESGSGRLVRLALAGILMLAFLIISPGPASALPPGATIKVNTTADDFIVNGNCTLREAIVAANSNTAQDQCAAGKPGLDTITFDTAQPVFQSDATITVSDNVAQDGLPTVIAPVRIDGSIGHAVYVKGWGGSNGTGFIFDTGSAGSILNDMVIGNWGDTGVFLTGSSGKVTLTNNKIGVLGDGTTAIPNNYGVWIESSNNVIGGLDAVGQARTNVISGNATDGILVNTGLNNVIQGNYIGTTANGLSGLGNFLTGIEVEAANNTQVGGILPFQGNVISGNSNRGLAIENTAQMTKVQRNFVGVGADGVSNLNNNNVNIEDAGGPGTLIGGTMPQAGNVIGNTSHGIWLGGTGSTPSIMGNLIGVNAHGGAAGGSNGILFAADPAGTTITGNLISHETNGINFQSNTPAAVTVAQNCIAGNAGNGTVTTGGPESLAGNWWGVATGPNTPGGDATSGPFSLSPWLTKLPTSCMGWAPRSHSPLDQSFRNRSAVLTKFSWGAVNQANGYHFTLSQNANLSSPLDNNVSTGLVRSHSDGPLAYGAYYWQTTTNTADGFAWPSPIHELYVTIMKSPKPGAAVASSTVTFKWLAYAGLNQSYDITIYDGQDCLATSEFHNAAYVGTSLSHTVTTSGPHAWQITPNVGGVSTMPCWSFTTP